MNSTILVLGATGQQGGAVARQLLAHGFAVRAFTRDAASDAARKLQQAGAAIFQGDLSDEASLRAALEKADGVFLVQPPAWAPTPESDLHEAQTGIQLIEAARRAGVRHLVYSSVFASDWQAAYRPRFKFAIEQHLWASGVPVTVLRPAVFMENAYLPHFGLAQGHIYNATPFELATPYVAVDDIGVFVRLAFQRPQDFIGQTLDLAGDHLTVTALAQLLSRALGRDITPVQVPLEVVKGQNELLGQLVETAYTRGFPAIDVARLRALHPGLLTFAQWVEQPRQERLRQLGLS